MEKEKIKELANMLQERCDRISKYDCKYKFNYDCIVCLATYLVKENKVVKELKTQSRKETAREILGYLVESGVINTAPETIKMYFKENYEVEK